MALSSEDLINMKQLSDYQRRIMVTGGAGFIGSNFLLYMVPKYPDYLFVNADALTYAGNLTNLTALDQSDNYHFERLDICNYDALQECFAKYEVDGVIHLAAESHVDRSITGPAQFIQTNIVGTFNLLQLALANWGQAGDGRFLHVSTDEVFGSLGDKGYFTEQTPYAPNSPYSASKASSDHLVRAYHHTYGLDVVTTNCSNNYGPYQFPEKLIPLIINNACQGRALPVYGDGRHVRDWLFVQDHCQAMDLVFHQGQTGETYNIGGHNEIENIELVRLVCRLLDKRLGDGPREDLIEFVTDRPGHDRRYAMDAGHIAEQLGWQPQYDFERGIRETINWYLSHQDWLDQCTSGEYRSYYDKTYNRR
jgi:dTDP-glucose 4,6-dehydratase